MLTVLYNVLKGGGMKFLTYNPEQAVLLPTSGHEVLGEEHVSFFLHRTVERLDLGNSG